MISIRQLLEIVAFLYGLSVHRVPPMLVVGCDILLMLLPVDGTIMNFVYRLANGMIVAGLALILTVFGSMVEIAILVALAFGTMSNILRVWRKSKPAAQASAARNPPPPPYE